MSTIKLFAIAVILGALGTLAVFSIAIVELAYLSQAQQAFLSCSFGAFVFMLMITVSIALPDFLAQSGPSSAVHYRRATVMVMQPAATTVKLLWGMIQIEVPQQQQTAWVAA